MFVGLNPSTADEARDDPTIRRCVGFARDWGFARLDVVNLYAFRSTDPRALWRAGDPVGPENDLVLAHVLGRADFVLAAWGVHARQERVRDVASILGRLRLHALGVTNAGAPRHPLYVRADARPSLYVADRTESRAMPGSPRPGQDLTKPAAVRLCDAP